MTAPDVEAIRARHQVMTWGADAGRCAADGHWWPCDAEVLARDVERMRGQLAAVLAECDRLDEDPGDVEPVVLVTSLIRHAATGEGS